MVAHTKYAAKFIAAKNKCVAKCLQYFWKGIGSESDCLPPYSGTTLQCIVDDVTLGGVENKFQLALEKACVSGPGADCPECYAGGCASPHPEDTVLTFEGMWDSFVPGTYCERAGATKYEQRCQLYTAKALTKQFDQEQKCYTKCFRNARSGGDVSTCLSPPTDVAAIACLAKAKGKSVAVIDKYCNDALYSDSVPECGGAYPNGASWANLVDVWINGLINPTFCASPSRAFVD